MIDERPLGSVFPPRSLEEIDVYDQGEALDAFIEYAPGDPEPGDNRSAAYRWAWSNAHFDETGEDDGHYAMRRAYARRLIDRSKEEPRR